MVCCFLKNGCLLAPGQGTHAGCAFVGGSSVVGVMRDEHALDSGEANKVG